MPHFWEMLFLKKLKERPTHVYPPRDDLSLSAQTHLILIDCTSRLTLFHKIRPLLARSFERYFSATHTFELFHVSHLSQIDTCTQAALRQVLFFSPQLGRGKTKSHRFYDVYRWAIMNTFISSYASHLNIFFQVPKTSTPLEQAAHEAQDELNAQINRRNFSTALPLKQLLPSLIEKIPEGSDQAKRTIFKTLLSDYRRSWVNAGAWVAEKMFARLFSDISISFQDRSRMDAIWGNQPLIIMPNHRSHLDYLLISYALYTKGYHPPLTAAGINLNIFLLGRFFRRTGAYFIRRSIGADKLYTKCLNTYLKFLLTHNAPQKFYAEGGRNRFGDLTQPKLGLLSMLFQQHAGAARPLHFLPCSIDYQFIPDANAMVQELRGADKKKESFFSLFLLGKYVKACFGEVHIRFGPVLEVPAPPKDAAYQLIKKTARHCADEVFYHIEKNQTCEDTSIFFFLSLALIQPDHLLDKKHFQQVYSYLVESLKNHFPHHTPIEQRGFDTAVDLALKNELLVDHSAHAFRIAPTRIPYVYFYQNSAIKWLLKLAQLHAPETLSAQEIIHLDEFVRAHFLNEKVYTDVTPATHATDFDQRVWRLIMIQAYRSQLSPCVFAPLEESKNMFLKHRQRIVRALPEVGPHQALYQKILAVAA